MEKFLSSIERQAFRMAFIACSNREDALDLVQDSMCQFVSKYSSKSQTDWKALFYRVLQNKIRDFYRKEAVRSRWRILFGKDVEDPNQDVIDNIEDVNSPDPERETANRQIFAQLQRELRALPLKQQQVFLLRAWQGLSITETSLAIGCAEGTVKTHYFRATERLRDRLGEFWS